MDCRELPRTTLEYLVDCYERNLSFESALVMAGVKKSRHVVGFRSDESFGDLWEDQHVDDDEWAHEEGAQEDE